MASRFVAPKRLETLEDVRKALQLVQEQFDANGISRARGQLVTKSTTLASGEFVRISPRQGQTLVAKLPKATADNIGLQIVVSLERPNGTLKIAAQKPDTVAGLSTASFTVAGLILLRSNGTDQWVLFNQLPTNSPASPVVDAEYVLGAADVDLPNGRVATDSTEIDADLTAPNIISWALRTASVGFSKLADLTGLSVLGRAANSSGVMAAITATAARQVLTTNSAGTALAWGFPVRLVSEVGADLGQFHSIRFHGGTHTTAASAIPGGAFGTDTAVVIYNVNTTTLAAALAGAGMTATAGVMNVIGAAGGYITVGANDVAWQGFDVDINTTGSPSVGWKGIDFIDGPGHAWNITAPGGSRIGASIVPAYGVQTLSGAGPHNDVALLSTTTAIRCDAACTITGFSGGTHGRPLDIFTDGGNVITLAFNSGLSLAGNRIATPSGVDFVQLRGGGRLIFDTSPANDIWRVVATPTPADRLLGSDQNSSVVVSGTNITMTGNDGVNPTNVFQVKDTNGDFNFANNSASNGFVVQTGLGVGGAISMTTRSVDITASGGNIDIDTNASMNLSADRVRLTAGAAFTSPGFLSFLEGASSTPTVPAGDGMVWVQNTAPSRLMYTSDTNADHPINVSCIATKTSTTTVTTAIASPYTSVISYTTQPNEAKITTTYRIKAKVLYAKTVATTATPIFAISFGGSIPVGASVTVPQTATAVVGQMVLDVEAMITIRTLGAVGAAVHSTMLTVGGCSTATAGGTNGFQNQTATFVDTTVAQAIELRMGLGATVASNSLTCNVATIERLD